MGTITTEAELEALYGAPVQRSVTKELDHLNEPYRRFVEASPLCILGSVGPEGVDVTPRGDPAPVAHVVDERTLLLPDRRGNNRIDTLRNIVRDGRVSLIFLVPGSPSTLRVIGRAEISADEALLARFEIESKRPRSVIITRIESVYFHCVKAFHRARFWDSASWPAASELPTQGDMLKAIDRAFDGASYDAGYPEHLKKTIY